jgi:hypothetical protein
MINYLVSWLGCAKSHGLTINYLGGWNERGYNISWYEQLRSTLNADGYSAVTIVGADTDWSIANDIDDNSAFAAAVGVIGSHYPCGRRRRQRGHLLDDERGLPPASRCGPARTARRTRIPARPR